jgi:hypothetical protein
LARISSTNNSKDAPILPEKRGRKATTMLPRLRENPNA